MPPAYDIHPEFGYFCPAPRARRSCALLLSRSLAGMAIGAAIMAIHAGQAAETEAVSGNAQLKSSAPTRWRPCAASELPHQGRRQRTRILWKRSSRIRCGWCECVRARLRHPCWDSARPYRATGATSLRRSGLARERRGSGLARGFTAGAISRGAAEPAVSGPRSGQALCMPDAIGTTRMRTHAGRTGVGPTGASALMPKIDIGAAHIATGRTDERRCRERAVARLAPQKAGLARPSDSGRTDLCGQDVCGIACSHSTSHSGLASTIHDGRF